MRRKIKRFVSILGTGVLVLSMMANSLMPVGVYAADDLSSKKRSLTGTDISEEPVLSGTDPDDQDDGLKLIEGYDLTASKFLTDKKADTTVSSKLTPDTIEYGNYTFYQVKTVKGKDDRVALEKSKGTLSVNGVPVGSDDGNKTLIRFELSSDGNSSTSYYIVTDPAGNTVKNGEISGSAVTTVDVEAKTAGTYTLRYDPQVTSSVKQIRIISASVYSNAIQGGDVNPDDPVSVSCNVTFRWGDNEKTIVVKKGDSISADVVPDTRDLYGFQYWMYNGDRIDPTEIIVSSDIIITAVVDESADPYHIIRFVQSVSENSVSENVISEFKKKHGAELAADELPSPSVSAGYEFKGWYLGNDTGTVYGPEDLIGTEVTADAIYRPLIEPEKVYKNYNIGFKLDDSVVYSYDISEKDVISYSPYIPVTADRLFLSSSPDFNKYIGKSPTEDLMFEIKMRSSFKEWDEYSGQYYMYDVTRFGTIEETAEDTFVLNTENATLDCDTDKSENEWEDLTLFNVDNPVLKSGKSYESGLSPVDGSLRFYAQPAYKKYFTGYILNSTSGTTTFKTEDVRDLFILTPNDSTYNSRPIKVDDESYTPDRGVVTVSRLPAGSHVISAGGKENVIMAIFLAKNEVKEKTRNALTLDADMDMIDTTLLEDEYYQGSEVRFSAKPKAGYRNLVVKKTVDSTESVLTSDDNGYFFTIDGDTTVTMTADKDTRVESGVSVRYSGASSTLLAWKGLSESEFTFDAGLNPGYEDLSVRVIKDEDGTDVTQDCLIKNQDGSYKITVPEYFVTMYASGKRIKPREMKVYNGSKFLAGYPDEPVASVSCNDLSPLWLEAAILPEESTYIEEWQSDDQEVATVRRGKINVLDEGDVNIRVSTGESISANILLKIRYPQPESVVIMKDGKAWDKETSLELTEGDKISLSAAVSPAGVDHTISWKSDDPEVAAVENGAIEAVSEGETYISLTVTGKGKYKTEKTERIKVIVQKKPVPDPDPEPDPEPDPDPHPNPNPNPDPNPDPTPDPDPNPNPNPNPDPNPDPTPDPDPTPAPDTNPTPTPTPDIKPVPAENKDTRVKNVEGAVYASENDNIAPVVSSGKINDMVLDLSNVASSNVKPDALKMTVISGTKLTVKQSVKDVSSAKSTGGVKVKVNKKTLTAVIKCKKDGAVNLSTQDGDYTITFKVEKPKAQKSSTNIGVGNAPVIKTVKDLFGTDIDAGSLTVVKQTGSQVSVSGNSLVINPAEKDKIKAQYKYLNKKYKISIKVK